MISRSIVRACVLLLFVALVGGCLGAKGIPAGKGRATPTPAVAPTPVAIAAPTATSTAASTLGQTGTPTPAATPRPTPTLAATAAATLTPILTPSATPTLGPTPTVTPAAALGAAPTGQTQEARVVRVVDGDTIRVLIGGREYPLRYIGIDTPETVHPNRPVEWMGPQATRANERLVEGRRVLLEKDISETDRFDRLLRYVWVQDGNRWLLVNLELVRRGFAQVSTYPPDVKYTDLFLAAQRQARQASRGLWGDPPATPNPTKKPREPREPRGNCDPSYPTVCIKPSPPDLDCGDIPHRRFKVRPPDPHRFDGDHDGIGCESG